MTQELHDLVRALVKIKQLDIEEAKIRHEKRRMFCVAEKMIDEMVKDVNYPKA